MRVTIAVNGFYDWVTVPPDVEVTPRDIAAGRVKPDKSGRGYDMRVTREEASEITIMVAESTVIGRIIHDLMPQQGAVQRTRKEAIAELIARNVVAEMAHPRHMTGFTVECDQGPDEKLFRETLAQYVSAKTINGDPLVEVSEVETIVSKYLDPADETDHVDHLHNRFAVKRAS